MHLLLLLLLSIPHQPKSSLNNHSLNFDLTATITDASCDLANGRIDLEASGGLAPYTFLWEDSTSTQNRDSLSAGTYTVKVQDFAGNLDSASFTVGIKTGPDLQTANFLGISGELKKWHRITLDFEGPFSSETCDPNPFMDYRMVVTFQNGKDIYKVPGFFAADGNSAESSATAGNIWRCHFAPDRVGDWTYQVSFQYGPGLALEPDTVTGDSISIDGMSGNFTITGTDKSGRDHRGKGRLSYVGERYLRFSETGEYFLKAGADSPENFLAYEDFDNTGNWRNYRKTWTDHIQDWEVGDPTWQEGKGKGIIGAINYLASKGMNVFSFLTYNVLGDDKNVFPYLTDSDKQSPDPERLRYDVSKLAQWEIVFSHADRKGMYLHFKLQEEENDLLMDKGLLGPERKLYFRELVARFGHHLALNWNLGEENEIHRELNDPELSILKSYVSYLYDLDPYKNHIVIHNIPGQEAELFTPLMGTGSNMTGASLQSWYKAVHRNTLELLDSAKNANQPWVIANDEQGGADFGVPPDSGYQDYVPSSGDRTQKEIRDQVLWGHFMAGGAGVEYYFGYSLPQGDLTCEDFRSRDRMWDYNRYALEFFQKYLPFPQMESQDSLINQGYAFAKHLDTYAFYFPDASQEIIVNLPDTSYNLAWYNPRTGGALESQSFVSLDTAFVLHPPDSIEGNDWVALMKVGNSDIILGEIPDSSLKNPIKIYPNPVFPTGMLNIEFDQEIPRDFQYEIIDLGGKRLGSRHYLENSRTANRIQLVWKNMVPGLYIIQLTGVGLKEAKKIWVRL